MRIAYTVSHYAPHVGGVETHVGHIARRVAARGHRVEVLTQEPDRSLPATEVLEGVVVRRFPLLVSRPYEFSPALWRYLWRHRLDYDLVHAHNYHAFPSIGAALSLRPLVFTPHYHGPGHTPVGRLLHVPYRLPGAWVFHRARRVICVSEAEAALVRRHYPSVARRIVVIPNGVETEALRRAEPYQTTGKVVLSSGRLRAYKNVHLLIEAMRYLDGEYSLVITGEGEERPRLERLTRDLGLQDRVRFVGQVDERALHRWFRTAAVYVSMSTQEAYGLTLAEAMAAEAPVVASDIPAHREAAVGNPEAGAHLLPLATAPEMLARAIEAAKRSGGKSLPGILSWDEVAERVLAVYQEILGSSRAT